MPSLRRRDFGWLADYPDFRDYTIYHDQVAAILKKTKRQKSTPIKLNSAVDLRTWCSPVEDQGSLGSCTAHAGVGIIEYFQKRSFGKHLDASRLFLYKVTRNLMHASGDTGAFLRNTMAAIALFGVPPEEYWPYEITEFDKEPPAFCYAFAQNYQAIQYFRLDPSGSSPSETLVRIKEQLAAGIPAMFGFTVYSSIDEAAQTGKIPFPSAGEKVEGGHAVAAVGYDDRMKIKNTTGAFLIRNSWGEGWGEQGYGWLPYEYVLKGVAVDWWCLIKSEWIDTEAFG